jgi:hypothetical protein
MNDRQKTYRQTRGEDSDRHCQAEQCALPPSLLPWTFEHGGMTLVLELCHVHGQALTGEQPADAGGEAA